MRKLFIFLLSVGLVSSIAAFSSNSVLANSEDVLGVSNADELIPPTIDGPGFILPDSPLYFLDKLKQEFRLVLAFTPEQKARIYASVAGERLAELRLMLLSKNQEGIQKALAGVSQNFALSAEALADAQLTGRDVTKLAENINANIKEKQQTLDELESKSGVVLKSQVAMATQALLGAKTKVENSLPIHQAASEIKGNIERMVTRNMTNASDLAKNTDRYIMQLQKHESESSKTSSLGNEGKKNLQALLTLQEKAAQDVKEAALRLQEATLRYQKLQDYITQLKNTGTIPSTALLTPTPTSAQSTTK